MDARRRQFGSSVQSGGHVPLSQPETATYRHDDMEGSSTLQHSCELDRKCHLSNLLVFPSWTTWAVRYAYERRFLRSFHCAERRNRIEKRLRMLLTAEEELSKQRLK